jgi:hypothetical protein
MNTFLTLCPVCGERLAVTRLHCRNCDTTIDGHFEMGRLGRLTGEQLTFVETFLRCEGKLNRMEREMGLSYPTLRARLVDVVRQMGFPPSSEAPVSLDEARHQVLDDLAGGRITSDEAMRLLEAS